MKITFVSFELSKLHTKFPLKYRAIMPPRTYNGIRHFYKLFI